MKTVAIIQARMGSTRLPGKVLRLLGGKSILAHVIERVSRAKYIDEVVVATTHLPQDEEIVNEAVRLKVPYYCGSESDVLSRYYDAAKRMSADHIVRVTSDCPLIDPSVCDRVISHYFTNRADYARLDLSHFPRGFDVEIFSKQALSRSHLEARDDEYREHVTLYMYRHAELFHNVSYSEGDKENAGYRLTLDTSEDWDVIQKVFEACSREDPYFGLEDTLRFLKGNPRIATLNSSVEQKHKTT